MDFVARNGENLSEGDIIGIMRRLSLCNDYRLSFSEFERFVLPNRY